MSNKLALSTFSRVLFRKTHPKTRSTTTLNNKLFPTQSLPCTRLYSSSKLSSASVFSTTSISPASRSFSLYTRTRDAQTHRPAHAPPLPEQKTQPKPSSPSRSSRPEYQITFTCTPCSTRSSHTISKQGYHSGSVLIQCPNCKNRHVISDHLGIFGDKSLNIEDLMRGKGQLVKKGTLSEDGGLEFWDDGSSSVHVEQPGAGIVQAHTKEFDQKKS